MEEHTKLKKDKFDKLEISFEKELIMTAIKFTSLSGNSSVSSNLY